jgi:hypothetical protein
VDVDDLSDDELRVRLTQRGVDPVLARDLIPKREHPAAHDELQRLLDAGDRDVWPPKLEVK